MRLVPICLVLCILSAPAFAGPAPRVPVPTRPSAEDLEHAFSRKDPVELERLGSRIGAVRLVALVERGTPAARRAALAALELTAGSIELLPRLIAVAASTDTEPGLAAETIETVRRIAERIPRGEIELEELPGDLLRSAADALSALADREDRPAALRVHAVAALAALATLEPAAGKKLAQLATTKEPHVRRAVADALPSSAASTLGRLLAEDGDNEVALAAAASLCRDVPPPGAEKKADRALARALELPPAARTRLRQLVRDGALAEPERLDVVPCLRPGAQRAEEQKADLDLLRELGRGPDGAMKKRARTYGGR